MTGAVNFVPAEWQELDAVAGEAQAEAAWGYHGKQL